MRGSKKGRRYVNSPIHVDLDQSSWVIVLQILFTFRPLIKISILLFVSIHSNDELRQCMYWPRIMIFSQSNQIRFVRFAAWGKKLPAGLQGLLSGDLESYSFRNSVLPTPH